MGERFGRLYQYSSWSWMKGDDRSELFFQLKIQLPTHGLCITLAAVMFQAIGNGLGGRMWLLIFGLFIF